MELEKHPVKEAGGLPSLQVPCGCMAQGPSGGPVARSQGSKSARRLQGLKGPQEVQLGRFNLAGVKNKFKVVIYKGIE